MTCAQKTLILKSPFFALEEKAIKLFFTQSCSCRAQWRRTAFPFTVRAARVAASKPEHEGTFHGSLRVNKTSPQSAHSANLIPRGCPLDSPLQTSTRRQQSCVMCRYPKFHIDDCADGQINSDRGDEKRHAKQHRKLRRDVDEEVCPTVVKPLHR